MLVVSVWVEGVAPDHVRIRITTGEGESRNTVVVADRAEALNLIERWLASVPDDMPREW